MSMTNCDGEEVDFDRSLIDAASSGDFKTFQNHLSTVENPNVYLNRVYPQTDEQNCSLLVIAYLANRLDFLRELIEYYHPDLETLNDVCLDIHNGVEELYLKVSLLWLATVLNDFDTVQMLVEHGANVNHQTQSHSTPVRGAFYHGNLSMVRFLVAHGADVNIHKVGGDTNLMLTVDREHFEVTVYLLEELKCDVNVSSDTGRSALYDAVKKESLEFVRLLIDHGALNFRDGVDQMSPLMWAAENRRRDLMDVIGPTSSSLDCIEADELYATAFLRFSERNYHEYFDDMYRALQRRLIHQSLKECKQKTHAVFHYRPECQTLEELEKIRDNEDEIINEALLMRERLMGAHHTLYHFSLRNQSVTYHYEEKYHRALELAIYEHEIHQEYLVELETDRVQCTLATLSQMVYRSLPVSIEMIERIIQVMEGELRTDVQQYNENIKYLLWLITIIGQLLAKRTLTADDRQSLYLSVIRLVRYQYRTNDVGSSLLHLSLNEDSDANDDNLDLCCQYPCLQTASLLLQCGADVNAIDDIHQTPLHILAMNETRFDLSLVHLLYREGAHIDCVNALGEIAEDLTNNPVVKSLLKSRREVKLKCLCARLIRNSEIPYNGKLSKVLSAFVDRH